MNNHLTELVITCASWQEAQRIADALLEKRLVASVETFEIKPMHFWEGHHHGTQEVKLVVMTLPKYFESVEAETSKQQKIHTKPILLTGVIKE